MVVPATSSASSARGSPCATPGRGAAVVRSAGLEHVREQELDRHRLMQREVHRLDDDAHAALTEYAIHAISPPRRSRRGLAARQLPWPHLEPAAHPRGGDRDAFHTHTRPHRGRCSLLNISAAGGLSTRVTRVAAVAAFYPVVRECQCVLLSGDTLCTGSCEITVEATGSVSQVSCLDSHDTRGGICVMRPTICSSQPTASAHAMTTLRCVRRRISE